MWSFASSSFKSNLNSEPKSVQTTCGEPVEDVGLRNLGGKVLGGVCADARCAAVNDNQELRVSGCASGQKTTVNAQTLSREVYGCSLRTCDLPNGSRSSQDADTAGLGNLLGNCTQILGVQKFN